MNDLIAEPFVMDQPEPHEDVTTIGNVGFYHRLQQGCDEWLMLRMGMITASEFVKLITTTLKIANNETSRNYIYELAAQRMNPVIEPHYMNFDMERGHTEEVLAKMVYARELSKVDDCGFIVNTKLGLKVGCSPDGLVGDDGMIEVKSRANKLQIKTIVEGFDCDLIDTDSAEIPVPKQFMMQIQAQLWVSGRDWCDFISYSNGLNMIITRVYPDHEYFDVIEAAAISTEKRIAETIDQVNDALKKTGRWYPVEYYNHHEDIKV